MTHPDPLRFPTAAAARAHIVATLAHLHTGAQEINADLDDMAVRDATMKTGIYTQEALTRHHDAIAAIERAIAHFQTVARAYHLDWAALAAEAGGDATIHRPPHPNP